MLRPAVREVYRVYDEHAFLSGSPPDDLHARPVERAGGRGSAIATVIALLLTAGTASALVALDGLAPFAPRGARVPRDRLARTFARGNGAMASARSTRVVHGWRVQERVMASQRDRAGARRKRAGGPAASAGKRLEAARATEPRRSAAAPAGTRSRAASSVAPAVAAVVQSAAARTQQAEFGFER